MTLAHNKVYIEDYSNRINQWNYWDNNILSRIRINNHKLFIHVQAHWEGGQPGPHPEAHECKQVESCFLNHNSSNHFCCTDSLLMTYLCGLSLSIIIWRIGGGGPISFWPGAEQFSWRPCPCVQQCCKYIT
jgi:hypothetical protein